MAFSATNTLEMMMALNCFHPQFDSQSIPPYIDWVANTTFDPFGPEPFAATSHPVPGTRLHSQTLLDTGSRVDMGCSPSEGCTTDNLPREVSPDPPLEVPELGANEIHQRSRFAFAQKRIERLVDVSAGQNPAAHVRNSSLGRSRGPSPIPIRTAPTKTSRVAGPRPPRLQRVPHARREATLAVPKPVYPLPMWLTHFEDYEQDLLADFDSSPLASTFPAMVRVRLPSEHASDCPPLNTLPLLGFEDSGYTDTEEEGSDEEDQGYHTFEFDTDSDVGSDYLPFGSESSTSASYGAGAIDWSVPFQGQVGGGDGYSRANPVTILEFPSPYFPSPPPRVHSFGSFDLAAQLPNFLPWSIFTNPFASAPATTSPAPSSIAPVAAYHPADTHVLGVDADRSLAKVEEGLGLGSLPEPTEVETEGRYDRCDLTGYTFPVPPQQPQSPLVAAGFEAPPLVHTGTIPLPDTEEGEDAELDEVVIPKGPWYWWW